MLNKIKQIALSNGNNKEALVASSLLGIFAEIPNGSFDKNIDLVLALSECITIEALRLHEFDDEPVDDLINIFNFEFGKLSLNLRHSNGSHSIHRTEIKFDYEIDSTFNTNNDLQIVTKHFMKLLGRQFRYETLNFNITEDDVWRMQYNSQNFIFFNIGFNRFLHATYKHQYEFTFAQFVQFIVEYTIIEHLVDITHIQLYKDIWIDFRRNFVKPYSYTLYEQNRRLPYIDNERPKY